MGHQAAVSEGSVWTHHFHYRTVVVVNRWGCVSIASGYCRTTVGVSVMTVTSHPILCTPSRAYMQLCLP